MKKIIQLLCLAIFAGWACQSNASVVIENASPNELIPDYPAAGASSDIYISSGDSQLSGIVNPYVAGVNSISFTITGSGGNAWDGDYTLVLQHVDDSGTTSQSLTLFSSLLGGTAANNGFANVTLSSTGSGSISDGASASSTAAITGTYGLNFGSTFQNVSPTGDWILYATDNQADNQGILSSWSLNLEVVPEPVNEALGIFGGLMGVLALWRQMRKFGKQKTEIGLGKS